MKTFYLFEERPQAGQGTKIAVGTGYQWYRRDIFRSSYWHIAMRRALSPAREVSVRPTALPAFTRTLRNISLA